MDIGIIITGIIHYIGIIVSSARGHGRADKAGPSLARDVEEASAGNRRAQSSVPALWNGGSNF